MKILNFDMYLDGGTVKVVTDEGVFCFDGRIKTKTKGKLYSGYPTINNSNLIESSEKLGQQILVLADKYGDGCLAEQLKKLLEEPIELGQHRGYGKIEDYSIIEKTIVSWLKDKATVIGKESFVVGVSGGIDSAVVSTLCAKTGIRTILLQIPISGENNELAEQHISWLKEKYSNVESYDINLEYDEFDEYGDTHQVNIYKQLITAISESLSIISIRKEKKELFDLANANTQSRLRMLILYFAATLNNGLVVGTGNKVEDYGIGFCSKYGDSAVDISPIGDLLKSEVRGLGKHMSVIDDIINAEPTDGLWGDNRNDRTQIGATYDELEWAMEWVEDNPRKFAYSPSDLEALTERQREILTIYKTRHFANEHKMKMPPICYLS